MKRLDLFPGSTTDQTPVWTNPAVIDNADEVSTEPAPAADDTEAWRAKFIAYYSSNAPSKVRMVTDGMMTKWAGKYEALYGTSSVCARVGVDKWAR